ncbi:MAG: OOP family OmpA-OmpF porin [Polaribacter sp.]|jgi:OOP family OmpA-OmpF porin
MLTLFPKGLLALTLVLVCSIATFAQSPAYTNGLSAKVLSINHIEPFEKTLSNFQDNTYGGELAYLRHLKGPLNLAIPFKLGLVDLFDEAGTLQESKLWLSTDVLLQLGFFKGDQVLAPYIMSGIGLAYLNESIFENQWYPQVPFGAGVQIRLHKGLRAVLQYEYRLSLTNDYDNDQLGVGLAMLFGGKPKIKDKDGDGIADEMDDCPEKAGLADLFGCPDTDGDGLADQFDKCPEEIGLSTNGGCPDMDEDGTIDSKDDCPKEAGPRENGGCPIADRDGDGVPDEIDQCISEFGLATNNGCPNNDNDSDGFPNEIDECPELAGSLNGCPDSDGDGVSDKNDKCPTTSGSNNGCPGISAADADFLANAMYEVEFNNAQATLATASANVMDQIAAIMRRYPNYNLAISGHTDSIGSAETNLMLSERRAKTCYDYLLLQGIDASRVSYVGYGEDQPIETNKYKAGREKNRRVEFNLFGQ